MPPQPTEQQQILAVLKEIRDLLKEALTQNRKE